MTAPIVLLMSVGIGLAVASNHYAQFFPQPINEQSFISNTADDAILTIARFSYMEGLMLLVPLTLGDMFERVPP